MDSWGGAGILPIFQSWALASTVTTRDNGLRPKNAVWCIVAPSICTGNLWQLRLNTESNFFLVFLHVTVARNTLSRCGCRDAKKLQFVHWLGEFFGVFLFKLTNWGELGVSECDHIGLRFRLCELIKPNILHTWESKTWLKHLKKSPNDSELYSFPPILQMLWEVVWGNSHRSKSKKRR